MEKPTIEIGTAKTLRIVGIDVFVRWREPAFFVEGQHEQAQDFINKAHENGTLLHVIPIFREGA